MEKLREKFLSIYANVPEPLRSDIIIVVNNKTYTWDSSYFEIKDNTPLGEEILKNLKKIGIL